MRAAIIAIRAVANGNRAKTAQSNGASTATPGAAAGRAPLPNNACFARSLCPGGVTASATTTQVSRAMLLDEVDSAKLARHLDEVASRLRNLEKIDPSTGVVNLDVPLFVWIP